MKVNEFGIEIELDDLVEVNPAEFAEELKIKFRENPELWYKVILPKEAADRLLKKTNNDYSAIWHEHCCFCWKSIDKHTSVGYKLQNGSDWVCADCNNKYKNIK